MTTQCTSRPTASSGVTQHCSQSIPSFLRTLSAHKCRFSASATRRPAPVGAHNCRFLARTRRSAPISAHKRHSEARKVTELITASVESAHKLSHLRGAFRLAFISIRKTSRLGEHIGELLAAVGLHLEVVSVPLLHKPRVVHLFLITSKKVPSTC